MNDNTVTLDPVTDFTAGYCHHCDSANITGEETETHYGKAYGGTHLRRLTHCNACNRDWTAILQVTARLDHEMLPEGVKAWSDNPRYYAKDVEHKGNKARICIWQGTETGFTEEGVWEAQVLVYNHPATGAQEGENFPLPASDSTPVEVLESVVANADQYFRLLDRIVEMEGQGTHG